MERGITMASWTYSDLHFYEWMLGEMKKSPTSKPEVVEERIIEIKRYLRRKNKVEQIKREEKTVVHDDGDYCIIKFLLPVDIQTKEEANEYFREEEYISYRPTYYDCTGQLFTSWYLIFRKPDGRFLAYHAIGMDV